MILNRYKFFLAPVFILLVAFQIAQAAPANIPATMTEVKTSFADTVKKTAPAVVNIFTAKVVQSGLQQNRSRDANPFFDDLFFNRFFGGNRNAPMRKKLERSLGSGVVVSSDGYIITNSHVVQGGISNEIDDKSQIKVIFNDKREFNARFVGADKNMDIAVLKIENGKESFDYIPFGDSDALEVGDVVLALGNPYGVGQSVSMGIVSALGRTNVGAARYENFIQTDAAINPGNSGGALVDSLGNLIGINTAIYSKSGGSQGIGFATPVNTVASIFDSVRKTGRVVRPWLGAGGQDLTSELAKQLGLATPSGVLINEIDTGGSAAKSGLEVGDIILTFDGQKVADSGTLAARIASSPIGETVELTVWRGGENLSLNITLEGLPPRKEEDRLTLGGNSPLAGYMFEILSPALNEELGLPFTAEGIAVVENSSDGGFRSLRLTKGDLLISVNKKQITTLKELQKATSRRPSSWAIVYRRGKSVIRAVVR